MPPKKKPRRASQGLSTPSIADPTETLQASASKADSQAPKHDVVADPWTDEEETALLKGIIRWKPVGVFNIACLAVRQLAVKPVFVRPEL